MQKVTILEQNTTETLWGKIEKKKMQLAKKMMKGNCIYMMFYHKDQ